MGPRSDLENVSASAGRDRCRVQGSCRILGNDLLLSLWGGDRPHIGSVVISQPRPSGLDPAQTGVTSSVHNILGHKDEAVARLCSERISSALCRTTVAVAGIHIEGASPEEIGRIMKNIDLLCSSLIKKLGKIVKGPSLTREQKT